MKSSDHLLRASEVAEQLSIGVAHWRAGVKSGRFPAGIQISSKVIAWKKSEIDAIINEAGESTSNPRFLRSPDVTKRLSVSRSLWWQGVKDGKYPPGIKLSHRVTVWRESDIDAIIATIGK